MKFQAILPLIAFYTVVSLASTVADVEADVQTISTQTTALNNAINGFPASGLAGALGIHDDAVTLGSAIDKGTSDVNGAPKPFSESDGDTIVAAVQGFEPTILNALSGIVAKKADFQSLPISGIPALVLLDLHNLNTSTTNFETALISASPSDLVPVAKSISATINAAFASAIAAYET